MLDHILGRVQAFEKRHGYTPNVVYINHSHFNILREQCPGLFSDTVSYSLGFHLILMSDKELAHPRIAWIPPRLKMGPEVENETATVLDIHQHRRAG